MGCIYMEVIEHHELCMSAIRIELDIHERQGKREGGFLRHQIRELASIKQITPENRQRDGELFIRRRDLIVLFAVCEQLFINTYTYPGIPCNRYQIYSIYIMYT